MAPRKLHIKPTAKATRNGYLSAPREIFLSRRFVLAQTAAGEI
jgi:hypothetical protein